MQQRRAGPSSDADEQRRTEWLEYPGLLSDEEFQIVVREFAAQGIAFSARHVREATQAIYQAETWQHALFIHADHAQIACHLLAGIFEFSDPELDTPRSGACPACEALIVDVLRCPSCGINVGPRVAADDPRIAFIREHRGFDDPDRQGLLRLSESGIDLARPIDIEFPIRFDDAAAAEEAAAAARRAGYPARVAQAADRTWTCICSAKIVATYANVIATKDELAAIALSKGGWPAPWAADPVACLLAQRLPHAADADHPVAFVFTIGLPDERSGLDFWVAAKQAGYGSTLESNGESAWACHCRRRVRPAADTVREAIDDLASLAAEFGGRMTTWGPARDREPD